MRAYTTGDLIFTRSTGLIGWLIRLGTAFWREVKDEGWIPNHVGILSQERGELQVYEATSSKDGVASTPLRKYLRKHRDYRIVRVSCRGEWKLIKKMLRTYDGVPYEKWLKMPSVAFDRNNGTDSHLFCSELAMRVLRVCPSLQWLFHLPVNNTDPDELYRITRKHDATFLDRK